MLEHLLETAKAVIVLLRAWTIWGCTRRITVILITLYILYFLALMPSVVYPQTIPNCGYSGKILPDI